MLLEYGSATVMTRSADTVTRTAVQQPERTSTILLERVRAQRPEAWQRLVKLYGPAVYVWSRHCGLQPQDAADVVQEVFLAVATHVGSFRRERPADSFRRWLWAITKNKIRDHFRRRQGEPPGQGGTDAQKRLAEVPARLEQRLSADTDAGRVHGLERRALELIRASFEQRTWDAFWQATVHGRTAAQIAAEMGMTKHAVRQAKYRVLKRLRQEIEGLWE